MICFVYGFIYMMILCLSLDYDCHIVDAQQILTEYIQVDHCNDKAAST